MADLYYYEAGYIDEKYFSYTADVVVGLQPYIVEGYFEPDYYEAGGGVSSLYCSADIISGVTVEASGSWSSAAALSADVYNIKQLASDQTAAFTQTTSAGNIQSAVINIESAFTPTLTVDAFKNSTAVLDTVVTVVADVVVNRSADIALSNIANLSAQGDKVSGQAAALSAEFTQTATATKAISSTADLTLQSTLSADVYNVTFADAALTSTTALTATGYINNKRPRQYTVTGSAVISTSTKKFDAGSLYVPAGSYATMPDSNDWDSWTTIDFHHYSTSTATQAFIGQGAASGNTSWGFGVVNNRYCFFGYNSSNTFYSTSWDTVVANEFNHVRLIRNGTSIFLYVDGTKLTPINSNTIPASFRSSTQPVYIGDSLFAESGNYYIDELLIRNDLSLGDGSASTITVPTSKWLPTSQTNILVLSHFDTNLSDDTGLQQAGAAALTSAFTQSAQAEKIAYGMAGLNTAVSIDISNNNIVDFIAVLAVEGFELISGTRIQSASASLSAQFTQSANAGPVKDGRATFNSQSAVIANIGNVKQGQVTISGVFNSSITVKQYEGIVTNLQSISSVSVTSNVIRGAVSAIQSVSSIKFYGRIAGKYFIAENIINSPLTICQVQSIDADDHAVYAVYAVTLVSGSSYVDPLIVKRNTNGDVLWEKVLNYTNDYSIIDTFNYVKSDGLGNVYVLTSIFEGSAHSLRDIQLTKLDSNGDLIWRQALGVTSSVENACNLELDINGNVYISGGSGGFVAKYNSSGAQQWVKEFQSLYSIDDMAIDASGNVYIVGGINTANTTNLQVIAKINSSGNSIAWQRILYDAAGGPITDQQGSIVLDSQNNVIASMSYYTNDTVGNPPTVIAKFSNNGSLIWQKQTANFIADMTIDYNDNLYLTKSILDYALIKASPDLSTIQFQHKIKSSSNLPSITYYLNDVVVDNNLTLYAAGSVQDSTKSIVARLPLDGSRADESYGPSGATNLFFYDSVTPDVSFTTSTYTFNTGSYNLINTDLISKTYSPSIVDGASYTTDSLSPLQLKKFDASLIVNSTISATLTSIKRSSITLTSTATMVTVGRVARLGRAALASTVTMNTAAVKATTVTPTLSAQFVVTANNTRRRDNSAALTSAITVVARPTDFTKASAALSSTANISATVIKKISISKSLAVTFTQTTDNIRVRNFDTSFTAIATELTAAAKNATGTVSMDATTSLAVTAKITREVAAGLSAGFTQVSDVENIVGYGSDLIITTSMIVDSSRLRGTGSNPSASFALTAAADKTVGYSATISSQAQLSASNNRIRFAVAALSTQATLTVAAQRIKEVTATLASQFTGVFLITKVVKFEAHLQAFDFVIVAGRILAIDPYLQFQVEPESRLWIVLPESRVFQVEEETRINLIL